MKKLLIWNDLSPELQEMMRKEELALTIGQPAEPNSQGQLTITLVMESFEGMVEYDPSYTNAEAVFVLTENKNYKFDYIEFSANS